MEIKQLALLGVVRWSAVRHQLAGWGDEVPVIVQVSRSRGAERGRQTRWYHCSRGEVHHLAGSASFCCGCGSVKAEHQVHYGLSAARHVRQFCRMCETEMAFVFELEPGIHLEHFNPHAHTWCDTLGKSFFNVG